MSVTRPRSTPTQVGTVSEAFAQAWLLQLGATLLAPIGTLRFDLGVLHHGTFWRIQVKTARHAGDYLNIPLFSQGRETSRSYDPAEVDFIVAWSHELQRAYILRVSELVDERGNGSGRRCSARVYLRLTPARNSQAKGVRLAADYELRDLSPFEAPAARSS